MVLSVYFMHSFFLYWSVSCPLFTSYSLYLALLCFTLFAYLWCTLSSLIALSYGVLPISWCTLCLLAALSYGVLHISWCNNISWCTLRLLVALSYGALPISWCTLCLLVALSYGVLRTSWIIFLLACPLHAVGMLHVSCACILHVSCLTRSLFNFSLLLVYFMYHVSDAKSV